MQLTRAADYAVRVMIHLAGLPPETRASRAELAEAAECPEQFLSKVLQSLTRAGLVSMLVDLARAKGVSAYVGEGENLWPAVHRLDAARLFNLALERAKPGTRLHAAAEEISSRAIAEAIGEALGVPVRGIAPEDAPAHFETIATFVGLDNPTSSALTRETFGWRPEGNGLLADIRESRGFQ